jgi:hypothetical protein
MQFFIIIIIISFYFLFFFFAFASHFSLLSLMVYENNKINIVGKIK